MLTRDKLFWGYHNIWACWQHVGNRSTTIPTKASISLCNPYLPVTQLPCTIPSYPLPRVIVLNLIQSHLSFLAPIAIGNPKKILSIAWQFLTYYPHFMSLLVTPHLELPPPMLPPLPMVPLSQLEPAGALPPLETFTGSATKKWPSLSPNRLAQAIWTCLSA